MLFSSWPYTGWNWNPPARINLLLRKWCLTTLDTIWLFVRFMFGYTSFMSLWLLILRLRLRARFHHRMPCRVKQIQWAPAHAHLLLIFHHLQRKSLLFVHQGHHAPCKRNLGPNHIWSASPATQGPGYDPLNVLCHYQGPSQLTRSPREDATWRSGKGTRHPPTQMTLSCRPWRWLAEETPAEKLQKLILAGGCDRGRPTKTWTKVICMDCLVLGLICGPPFRQENLEW